MTSQVSKTKFRKHEDHIQNWVHACVKFEGRGLKSTKLLIAPLFDSELGYILEFSNGWAEVLVR